MCLRSLGVLLLVALFCSNFVKADVPPDSGYTRLSIKLIIETPQDFPDYHFFIQSFVDVQEIDLKKGVTFEMDAPGGGAAKSVGTLLAIPKKNLTEFGEILTPEKSKKLQTDLEANKIAGVIKILAHSFRKDVPIYQEWTFKNPKYRLEADQTKIIKAVQIEGTAATSENDENSLVSKYWLPTVIVGALLSLSIVTLGIWLIRKLVRKS